MVINTDKSSQPGSHWVALFFPSRNRVLYFDSYGVTPTQNGPIAKFLAGFKHVEPNGFPVQSIVSNVCAAYCVYFIYMCSRGKSLADILSSLSHKKNSDAYVREFLLNLMEQQ
jgi:hypothetical protein